MAPAAAPAAVTQGPRPPTAIAPPKIGAQPGSRVSRLSTPQPHHLPPRLAPAWNLDDLHHPPVLAAALGGV